jgi:hypothetical protein
MKVALTGWAAQKCLGPGVQFGHSMRQVHGLAFCAVCGGWATPSGAGSRGIRKQCPGHAGKRGQELLRRLACNPPRLPDLHGRKSWPDGTPTGPPAALAAAGRKRRAAGVPPTPCRSGVASRAGIPLSQAERRRAAIYDRIRAREFANLRCASLVQP